MFFDFVGVNYEEDVDIWIAEVKLGSEVVYQGNYGDPEIAAVGREVAILKNGWAAQRNFPEETLDALCKRFAASLEDSFAVGDVTWHEWVSNIGLTPEEFLLRADVHLPSESGRRS
ncbi:MULTISPECIES: hypothetical protein [Myxococcus]|uniref:Uncharacterized protein n=1 Tax=Myxococcus llanfairpwllgwyngyllgogerychwyrndrobwllllantysiliogogogochensis TaxID=2590453 RepID=A0A540X3D5_9BACT|nr:MULTISPECIES: hypothetical protein [Myxococcus]NTX04381.1 hypothetical protein [Myxococcus sp. CA040A]TQF15753.1 hypothetical protein FJV41_11790 [Myxococcus llanfairpwllgwyngyllgogerychwyrndrobwllllantysiliogogogochensis]